MRTIVIYPKYPSSNSEHAQPGIPDKECSNDQPQRQQICNRLPVPLLLQLKLQCMIFGAIAAVEIAETFADGDVVLAHV